jgi:hypothetical protein
MRSTYSTVLCIFVEGIHAGDLLLDAHELVVSTAWPQRRMSAQRICAGQRIPIPPGLGDPWSIEGIHNHFAWANSVLRAIPSICEVTDVPPPATMPRPVTRFAWMESNEIPYDPFNFGEVPSRGESHSRDRRGVTVRRVRYRRAPPDPFDLGG